MRRKKTREKKILKKRANKKRERKKGREIHQNVYIVLYCTVPYFVAHCHCDIDSRSVVQIALLYFMLCPPMK